MPHEQKMFYVVSRLKCDSKGWIVHILNILAVLLRAHQRNRNVQKEEICFVRRLIGMNGLKLCYNIRLPLFVFVHLLKIKISPHFAEIFFIRRPAKCTRTHTNTFRSQIVCVIVCCLLIHSGSRFNRMVCFSIPWYLHQLMDLCSLQAKYGSKPSGIEWNASLDHAHYSVGTVHPIYR